LTAYDWPGNIRELENVMQRAMILAPGDVIEVGHLALPKPEIVEARSATAAAAGEVPMPADMRSLERKHILDTLSAAKGVRKVAAERLGMSERTLRYKLQQYRGEGFPVPGSGQDDSPA
jgi:two-component system response regulator FlrC